MIEKEILTTQPSLEAVPVAYASPLMGRRICIDPGHDAYWTIGASGYTRNRVVPRHPADQIPLHEHESTLSVSYRLKSLLEAEGALVCVTRTPREEGGGLQKTPYDFSGDGRVRTLGQAIEDVPEVIQPRIDWANDFGAEVLVSIHFNGAGDASLRGTEVYYSDTGPRQEEGHRLATRLLRALLDEMAGVGHGVVDRGVRSDKYQRYSAEETRRIFANNATTIRANGHDPANCGECYRLATTGNNPMSLQRGVYLAAIVEIDFLSNPDVVEGFIMRPDSFDVIARGLLAGLTRYFEGEALLRAGARPGSD
jgi:N-acetylmuramoyl-L-alanine amidase